MAPARRRTDGGGHAPGEGGGRGHCWRLRAVRAPVRGGVGHPLQHESGIKRGKENERRNGDRDGAGDPGVPSPQPALPQGAQ